MSWASEVAIEPLGVRRFAAHIDDSWMALHGVNGGIVAALAVRAVESVLRDEGVDPAATLRAASLGYRRRRRLVVPARRHVVGDDPPVETGRIVSR